MDKRDVAEVRQLLGLSQSELAAQLGIDRTTVVKYESGQSRIKGAALTLLRRLATERGIAFIPRAERRRRVRRRRKGEQDEPAAAGA